MCLPIISAEKRGHFKILITSYLYFSIRSFSVRQWWSFTHRLFRSPCCFSLPSSYLPFCRLSSPLEAVQVHGEERKLKLILIAALVNAAVRDKWATIVWHLYHLCISIIHSITIKPNSKELTLVYIQIHLHSLIFNIKVMHL